MTDMQTSVIGQKDREKDTRGGGGEGGVGHIFCLSGMDRGPEAPGNEMISIQIT